MDFQGFAEDIRKHGWPVFGAEVYAEGDRKYTYGDTKKRHPIYSATKTITALAVGMAVDAGKMDVHKSLLCYLPKQAKRSMTGMQREAYQHISIHRLMCMSVGGYPFRLSSDNWLEEALAYPVQQEPMFNYSNISAYLVGVAAAEALEEDLYSYLERKLFCPLGIDKPACMRCPDGYFYGASGMELSVQELSRIGLLLYNKGEYEGTRIVSSSFVQAACACQHRNREGGYGYFIWQYRDGFSINGKWGQKCYVLPGEGKMITFLSHMEEDTLPLRQSMEKHLL